MLEYPTKNRNIWSPPEPDINEINEHIGSHRIQDYKQQLFIIKEQPYIDAIYADFEEEFPEYTRFVFFEDNSWGYEKEQLFVKLCLSNPLCICSNASLEHIYEIYSAKYPEWKLDRYLTKRKRLLDHIYNCFKKNTAKEMLYKAGLDELAFFSDKLDEYDLLSTRPSDIYEGISMRALRALNCKEGAILLLTAHNRNIIKQLQSKYPDIFKARLNDSQCKYINWLISNDLTVGELGRLYMARSSTLSKMWASTQYSTFISIEKNHAEAEDLIRELGAIDPFYSKYLMRYLINDKENSRASIIRHYLTDRREEYDRAIRRSNRKRDFNWQERDNGYVVRYPQTINYFCREVVYQCNCMLGYLDAIICNDTTLLFMRKPDNYNKPFITIEIYNNRLAQAYHNFNNDCTKEEAEWILDYCKRHGIQRGSFQFNNLVDDLM